MTANQALEEFIELSVKVLDMPNQDAAARSAALEKHVHALLEKHAIERERRLMEPGARVGDCKLCAYIPSSLSITD